MSKLGRNLIKVLKKDKSTWEVYKDLPFLKRIIKTIYLSDLAEPILNPYYSIRHFFGRVKRIIEWLPILWKTEDWDSAFMLEIWTYSLKRLKRGTIDRGHHVVTKSQIRKMDTAIRLLERLSKDHEYTDKHYEAFYKKWGQPDCGFEPSDELISGNKTYTLINRTEEKLSEEEKQKYKKELFAVHKLEDYHFNQDIDLLFKLLKKHLRSWWD